MSWRYECNDCGNTDSDRIEYLGHDVFRCNICNSTNVSEKYIMSPFQRQEAAVLARGNKWQIENWYATHY